MISLYTTFWLLSQRTKYLNFWPKIVHKKRGYTTMPLLSVLPCVSKNPKGMQLCFLISLCDPKQRDAELDAGCWIAGSPEEHHRTSSDERRTETVDVISRIITIRDGMRSSPQGRDGQRKGEAATERKEPLVSLKSCSGKIQCTYWEVNRNQERQPPRMVSSTHWLVCVWKTKVKTLTRCMHTSEETLDHSTAHGLWLKL